MSKENASPSRQALREAAEQQLARQAIAEASGLDESSKALLHELRVHQLELSMQNETLQRALDESDHMRQQLRRQVEALEIANAKIREADQSKSRFLAAASHDLRQPLAALILYIDLLAQQLSGQNRPEASLIKPVKQCLSSLNNLLNNLLDISKLEAGVVQPKLADVAVDVLIEQHVLHYQASATAKSLRLRTRPGNHIIRTDLVLFGRMLGNLLANAIHHTETGGVLICCRQHQQRLWIEVWDSGSGIASHDLPHIFKPFFQVNKTGSDEQRGSGLGLSIVERCAALLGLQIRVCSKPGKGSMFAIEVLPSARQIAPVLASPNGYSSLPRPCRIALIEDHAAMRQALSLVLQSAGHQVIQAGSGADLAEKLGQFTPELLIANFQLSPAETGLDVIKQTRQLLGRKLPAIIMTGDTNLDLLHALADKGILVLHKPLDFHTIQSQIHDLMCWR